MTVSATSLRQFAATWWFVLPGLLFYAAVTLVPAASGVVQAFSEWDGYSANFRLVGFDNFVAIARDRAVVTALINTLTIAISTTILQNVIGLFLALGVNSRIKSRKLLRNDCKPKKLCKRKNAGLL